MSTTSDLAQAFIDESRRYLSAEYLPKIRACLEHRFGNAIWWRANEASNSIGNLVLHLAGNVRQWIASGVGGAPDIRDRPREFAQREPISRAELLSRLTEAVGAADACHQTRCASTAQSRGPVPPCTWRSITLWSTSRRTRDRSF